MYNLIMKLFIKTIFRYFALLSISEKYKIGFHLKIFNLIDKVKDNMDCDSSQNADAHKA